MASHHQQLPLRQALVRSVAEECGAAREVHPAPADRQMLDAAFIGKVRGICCGFSMPDDANQAMLHLCEAMIEHERARAASFDAEDGPFASTFAIYAEEARARASEIEKAKDRWAVTNLPAILQSIEYLLGHAIDQTRGAQRERIFAATRHIQAASDGAAA